MRRQFTRSRQFMLCVGLLTSLAASTLAVGAAAGSTTVTCDGLAATIVGTPGHDTLRGTAGPDVIAGLQGNDIIRGLGGNDIICAGKGNDQVYGGKGFDIIYGAQGNDALYAANGSEAAEQVDVRGARMFGGAGDDTIYGSNKWDRMQGGPGKDSLYGFDGRDWMRGGPDPDRIEGGSNIDDVHGGNGNDTFIIAGNDKVRGGAGKSDTCIIASGSVPSPIASCEIGGPKPIPPVPASSSWPEVETPNITGSDYIVELGRWDIPNNGTQPKKTKENLQKALDWASENNVGQFKLPAGTYLIGDVGNDIYYAGVTLHDNMALVLDDNAEIRLNTNDKWNSCAIAIRSKTNVAIIGGTISGDRNTHIFTPRPNDGKTAHDEGHNICVEGGSSHVLIDSVHLRQATGDGILLVGNRTKGSVKHITITNNDIDGNRRQGVSIVGAEQVLIENNEIHHTNGTSPQFGIDIESLSFNSENIIIRKNNFYNNRGGDIVNTDGKNVLVEHNTMRQGGGNRYIDGPLVSWPAGDWTVRGNTITMVNGSVNGKSGFIGYAGTRHRGGNPPTSFFVNNTCNGCGMYVYNSANMVVKGNTFNDGYIVMQYFENAMILNNTVTHGNKCWAYRFLQVSGQASGNTYNGEAFDIPLSSTPWDGCWVR